jgi:hypothetical protein
MKKTKDKPTFGNDISNEFIESSILEEIRENKKSKDIDDVISKNELILLRKSKQEKKKNLKRILVIMIIGILFMVAVSMILPDKFNIISYILDLTNQKQNYIIFEDKEMESIIQESIFKQGEKLTKEDLDNVFEINISSFDKIDTYNDLLKLKNLKTLIIKDRKDVNFNIIEQLNLNKLVLNQCEIKNLAFLENYNFLKVLDLSKNNITQIDYISKINTLEELILDENSLKSMGNLYEIDNLKKLSMKKNEIENVESLDKYKNLEYLDLSRNKIVNTTYLENYSKIEKLIFDISNAQIQGKDGWYLLEKEKDNYIELKWDLDKEIWKSSYDEGQIKDNHLILDNSVLAFKWVNEVETSYNFSINIVSSISDDKNSEDGKISFKIVKKGKSILERNIEIGEIFSLKDYIVDLEKNEEVYFTFEKSNVESLIDLIVDKDIVEKKEFNAKKDFSSNQSYGGWTYIEKNDDKISELNWIEDNSENEEHWISKAKERTWLGIWPDMMYPGISSDSIRRWTAFKNGNISIDSTANILNIGNGDGVDLFINHKDKNIWKKTLNKEEKINFKKDNIQILKGEYIDFIVNKRKNIYYDTVIWNQIISYE